MVKVVFLVSTILVLALSCFAAEELVINGGFEEWVDGTPAGWTISAGATEQSDAPVSIVSEVSGSPDGSALGLGGGAETKIWMAVTQDISVIGMTQLTVKGRAASRDVQPDGHRFTNCQLMFIIYDADGNYLQRDFVTRFQGTQEWTEAEMIILLPLGAKKMTVSCFLSMSGEAMFDDVSVIESWTPPESTGSRVADWHADCKRFIDILEIKHPDPFAIVNKESFVASLHAVADEADELTDFQLALMLMRVVATLGDAHTGVGFPDGRQLTLGAGFALYDDEIRVTWAVQDLADLVGGRLIRCGDSSTADVMAALEPLVSAETEAWRRAGAIGMLRMPTILNSLGLIPEADAVTYTVLHDDGRKVTLTADTTNPSSDLKLAMPPEGEGALRWSRRDRNWIRFLEDEHTLYVKYGACRNTRELSLDTLGATIQEHLDTRNVHRFVLDLRQNGGGSSHQLKSIAAALAERRESDHPIRSFVLTDTGTFSSAVLDAAYFVLVAGAEVAGEPTGQRPDHFGQVWSGVLPLSGLPFGCSSTRFGIMADNPGWVPVDHPVVETWEDFTAGRDPVLEAVLGL